MSRRRPHHETLRWIHQGLSDDEIERNFMVALHDADMTEAQIDAFCDEYSQGVAT